MHEFILASSNEHKAKEFSNLFTKIKITVPKEKIDIEESGKSFYENAFLKAQGYFKKFKQPIFSDDSGLVVEALPDELGVHSARFGGNNLTDHDRNELLLNKLQNSSRDAYFICVLCFLFDPQNYFFFEGRLSGEISQQIEGKNGFGHDPLFIPLGQKSTLATIPQWKEGNSHRAKACNYAQNFFT